MALHRIFNTGSDALITGDDGSLWEAGEDRYLEFPDHGWLDGAVASGQLIDLGEQEPPAPPPAGPSLPVPPETESEGA